MSSSPSATNSRSARGAGREGLALGIHRSVVQRTLALVRGLELEAPLLFTEDGALNACLVRELGLQLELRLPEHPQHVASLGCALSAVIPETVYPATGS